MDYPDTNVQSMIQYHLDSGNIQQLENFVKLGYKRLDRTQEYVQLMEEGFLKVTAHYADNEEYFGAIENIEFARRLTPDKTSTLEEEFHLFELLFAQIREELVKKDVKLFRGILHILLHQYEEQFPGITRPLQELDESLASQMEEVEDAAEGRVTFHLERLLLNMFDEMPPEKQQRIVGEIIGDKLYEEVIEKVKRKKERTDSKDEE